MDIKNQQTGGMDGYPCSMHSAYDKLVNFRNPQAALWLQNEDGSMAFVQEDKAVTN